MIPHSELPATAPVFGEQAYDDDTFPYSNIMQNHIPSINIDTTVHPHLNTRGLSSPVSTTPLTPGFVSPSQPGYSSSPSLLAVTPPTPAMSLGTNHDAFPMYSPSTPVSPFGSQHPWPIPKHVRTSLVSSGFSLTGLPPTATVSGARASPSS